MIPVWGIDRARMAQPRETRTISAVTKERSTEKKHSGLKRLYLGDVCPHQIHVRKRPSKGKGKGVCISYGAKGPQCDNMTASANEPVCIALPLS